LTKLGAQRYVRLIPRANADTRLGAARRAVPTAVSTSRAISSAYWLLLLSSGGTVIGRSLIPDVTSVKNGRAARGSTTITSIWTRSEASPCHTVSPVGVVRRVGPVMRLVGLFDLDGIVRELLHPPTDKGSNASGVVATIVASMLTGADLIDDLVVVRHGGMALLSRGSMPRTYESGRRITDVLRAELPVDAFPEAVAQP
jgi:hypothetical protein